MRTNKRWTEKEVERLTKYWQSGMKLKEIQIKYKKSRTPASIVVKINSLQHKGLLKYRHVDGGKNIKTKVVIADGGKTAKEIPNVRHSKLVAELLEEVEIHKDGIQARIDRIQELKKQAEDNQTLIKHLQWKNKQYWDELFAHKYNKKFKHSVWEPYSIKRKTPEWVKAGKKAMGQPMSDDTVSMKRVATSMSSLIRAKCFDVGKLLEEKNAQYGDSALNPIRVFSKADATEQLKVRIDDKLSRLVRGDDSIESDEDVIKDLIGYLVLLLIQYDTQAQAGENA